MIPVKRQTAWSLPQLLIAIVVSCFMVSCMQQPEENFSKDDNRHLTNPTSAFIYNMIPENAHAAISPEYNTAINTFSVKLLDAVYKNESYHDKNVVLSPFCISRNLAIITEATTGTSKQELLDVLGGQTALDDATSALRQLLYADKTVILQCADAIWVDSTRYVLQSSFKTLANTKYGVEATALDFENVQGTIDAINKWIALNTNNYIINFIDESFNIPGMALFLTSAIYFKADWTSPFDVNQTHPQQFTTPDGPVEVGMMTSSYQHQIFKTGEYENVKLYYGTGSKDFFYLDVYMPTAISVDEFIAAKCLTALGEQDSLGYGGLSMPKFFFETEVDLKPVLESMGVNGVFDESKSEITAMASHKGNHDSASLYLDLIRHKAGIKTDEEGTVAYAVTVSGAADNSADMSPDVVLDRPFVYFIRAGRNGLVLFAGVVNNPIDGK